MRFLDPVFLYPVKHILYYLRKLKVPGSVVGINCF